MTEPTPIKSGVSLDLIYSQIRSLDIIFFAGTGAMSAAIICCQARRQKILDDEPIFSHCGVAIRGSDIVKTNPNLQKQMEIDGDPKGENQWFIDENEVYILEAQLTTKSQQVVGGASCACGLAEFCTGCGAKLDFWKCGCEKMIYGVLFRSLKEVITEYDATPEVLIHYGKLKNNMFRDEQSQSNLQMHRDQLTNRFLEYRTLPYDYGCCGINMCAVMLTCCRPCRFCITCSDTESAVVCSELVAIMYRDFGIIPSDTRTANVSPMDFLDYEQDDKGIPKGIIQKPTVLITAYVSEESYNFQKQVKSNIQKEQYNTENILKTQPRSNAYQMKVIKKSTQEEVSGPITSKLIEIDLENMNLGIDSVDRRDTKKLRETSRVRVTGSQNFELEDDGQGDNSQTESDEKLLGTEKLLHTGRWY